METTPFKSWAVLELMGHRRLAGYVQEVTIACAGMLRIDVPGNDGDATQFVSPSSVYALTPATEATARAIAKGSNPAPVNEYEFPALRGKALPEPGAYYDDPDGDDDETPRETLTRLVSEDGLATVLQGLAEVHADHEVDGRHDDHDRYASILAAARALVLTEHGWPLHFGAGPGVEAIAKARDAQIDQGYTAEHDDALESDGALARAAAWILAQCDISYVGAPIWAHTYSTKHKDDRPRMLATVGALIAAEIDQLKRAETKAPSVDAQAADLASSHPSGVDRDASAPCGVPAEVADEVQF